MILTCPSCGAAHSAEAWENDVAAREAMQSIVAMPPPVAKAALGYFALFRPEKRALTWKKVKTIAAELTALVATGHVQMQGKAARPCPPHLWALAMEHMCGRTDLARPMKNHNYLRTIAWQLADQADARQERSRRTAETDGTQRVVRKPAEQEGMSELMRKVLEKQGGRHAAE